MPKSSHLLQAEEFEESFRQVGELTAQGRFHDALELGLALRCQFPDSEELLIKLILLRRELNQVAEMVDLCFELSASYGRSAQRIKQAELLATLPYIDETQNCSLLQHRLGLERADMLRFFGYYEASLLTLAEVLREDMEATMKRATVEFLEEWLHMGPDAEEASRIEELLQWLRTTGVPL